MKEIPKPIHSVREANAIFPSSVFRWLSIGIVLTKIRANSIQNGTKNDGLRSFWDVWGSLFHVLGVPRGPREVPWVPGCSQDGFGQVLGGSWGSLGIILGPLFEHFSVTNRFWDVVLGVRRWGLFFEGFWLRK